MQHNACKREPDPLHRSGALLLVSGAVGKKIFAELSLGGFKFQDLQQYCRFHTLPLSELGRKDNIRSFKDLFLSLSLNSFVYCIQLSHLM